MSKTLTVSTTVQKEVMEQFLLPEMSSGFWKNARPADHADYWKGVKIVVGSDLGPVGFDVPRNYNFVNPDFFSKNEVKMMAVALATEPNITVKQLKKQLIALNQIIGNRLKVVGGNIRKLSRGNKSSEPATAQIKKTSNASVRKVIATFAEVEEQV